MVKMMKMGVGALAFAALDAFGNEAMEYVQDDQVKKLHGKRRRHRSKSGGDNLKNKANKASTTGESTANAIDEDDGRPLALFDNEENTDVIFLVGEEPDVQRIPAHSWVLVDKSPVFRAMFKGPLALTLSNQQQASSVSAQPVNNRPAPSRLRHRTSSGNSYDKYPASSLSTIPDNEDDVDEEQQDLLAGKPIEFEVKANETKATEDQAPVAAASVGNLAEYTFIDVTDQSVYSAKQPESSINKNEDKKLLPVPTIVVDACESGAEGDHEAEREDLDDTMSALSSKANIAGVLGAASGTVSKATIAVSDVDGRAFDILLRYLYNETVNLQSVMTALTTLYAAHKYMCPGLAKQVVCYLRENLTEKNVLLVLQHICLYCSSASGRSTCQDWSNLDENPPITVGPSKRCRSVSMYDTSLPTASAAVSSDSKTSTTAPTSGTAAEDASPSAPPLPTICENEEEEQQPLLDPEDFYSSLEDDQREFEAGMVVSTSKSGRKVNCCDQLLKQCLELIDREASYVLASEDVEDLDISALNMIVCRDTLRLNGGEVEVFNAVKRWSTRECKRQRLELTSENRRRVLEGAQYLVRYLIISKEDFKAGPYTSGLLTSEEAEAVLANLEAAGANNITEMADLPDHLLYWHSIWKKPRRGRDKSFSNGNGRAKSITNWNKRGSISSLRRGSVTPSFKDPQLRQDSLAVLPGRDKNEAGQQANIGGANGQSRNRDHHDRHHNKEKFNFIEEFFICLACIFD